MTKLSSLIILMALLLAPAHLSGASAASLASTPVTTPPIPLNLPDSQSGDALAPRPAEPGPAATATGPALAAASALLAQNPSARVSYDPATGLARFVGADPEHPLTAGWTAGSGAESLSAAGDRPESAARAFLKANAPLFGLAGPDSELAVMRTQRGEAGQSFVRFQQKIAGVPVLGGELVVQLGGSGSVLSAGGKTVPDDEASAVNPDPAVSAAQAVEAARAAVAEAYGVVANADELSLTEPSLWIYEPRILGGPGTGGARLVWRTVVQSDQADPPVPIRELVLVDARLGGVALHFSQIETGKFRQVYDLNNVPGAALPGALVRSEGGPVSAIADANNFYDFAGYFYDYYYATHARDSIDGAGMTLKGSVRYCSDAPLDPCPYDNAFWNGEQMVFGQGFASALDVVAHEMTHGVTQYESNLFYYYQSGAISESLSDLWGELVENFVNPPGGDPDPAWLVGEDIPGGAIRSMSNPSTSRPPQPDSMTSTIYDCTDGDGGGVHRNSGVGNKAAYLIAAGIGELKTAKIYYTVQTQLLTSASDYLDLYNDVQQACTSLAGSFGITGGDCQIVKAALDTVKMNQTNSCVKSEAPTCPEGQLPRHLFFDDLERPELGNWASGTVSGGRNLWYYPPPGGLAYATSGRNMLWGDDRQKVNASYYMGMTKDVALPGGTTAYLRFDHAHYFRSDNVTPYDGGILEYSTDGGISWQDAASLFTHYGYNNVLATGTANPLAGRLAFAGMSGGYTSSLLNLSSLKGQNVRFRFLIGSSDHAVNPYAPIQYSGLGWFVDDVMIYTCTVRPTGFRLYMPLVVKGWPLLPAAPVLNPIANPAGAPSYTVSWQAAANAGVYLLAEGTTPDLSSAMYYQMGSTRSQQVTGKEPGTYHYWVKALNNFGESAWSSPVWTTVAAQLQPPDVPVLQPIGNAGHSPSYTVAWNAAARATTYTLQDDTDPGFPHPSGVYVGGALQAGVTDKPAGTYYYRVRASNSAGDSAWSQVQSTVVSPPAQGSIRGQVTNQGSGITGIHLVLRFYDGMGWSTRMETDTATNGLYDFVNPPALLPGQSYYVRYINGPNGGNIDFDAYLSVWYGASITTFGAGNQVSGGDFDIANIVLTSPNGEVTLGLPAVFQWQLRGGTPSDSYSWEIFDLNSYFTIFESSHLGYTGTYMVSSLPAGVSMGTQYGWDVLAYGASGGYGMSYYYRIVTFAPGLVAGGPAPEVHITRADGAALEARVEAAEAAKVAEISR